MVPKNYSERTPDDYLKLMQPHIFASLNSQQLTEFHRLLQEAIPKPSPKIVDLRLTIDLLFSRYYVVLWVGNDRRKSLRRYSKTALTRTGNFIAALLILFSLNMTVAASLFMLAYLLKSAAGIDFLPGHLQDHIESL